MENVGSQFLSFRQRPPIQAFSCPPLWAKVPNSSGLIRTGCGLDGAPAHAMPFSLSLLFSRAVDYSRSVRIFNSERFQVLRSVLALESWKTNPFRK